jgi:cation transport regulator
MFWKSQREVVMPYASNEDLPESVRAHLPDHAQDIFRAAFNAAWRTYSRTDPMARRVAWAAVKRRYCKLGDAWVLRERAEY